MVNIILARIALFGSCTPVEYFLTPIHRLAGAIVKVISPSTDDPKDRRHVGSLLHLSTTLSPAIRHREWIFGFLACPKDKSLPCPFAEGVNPLLLPKPVQVNLWFSQAHHQFTREVRPLAR